MIDSKRIKSIPSLITLTLLTFTLTQCGAAGTRVGNPPTTPTTASAFPSNFAITSPLESADEASANVSALMRYQTTPADAPDGYEDSLFRDETLSITTILNGTTLSDCYVDPTSIVHTNQNATCYGPTIDFENHPDTTGDDPGASGQLPSGDTGLWTATEPGTNGEACAAAQQNRLIEGVGARTNRGLRLLASLLCVASVNELDLPSTGSSIELSTQMNEMILGQAATSLNLNYTAATLSHSTDETSGNDIYRYTVSFSFERDNNGDPMQHDVELNLVHSPLDSTNATFTGRMTYFFNSPDSPKCVDQNDTFDAGAISYNKNSATELKFAAHSGFYCGLSEGPFDDQGQLDPTSVFDANTNATGWADNYRLLLGRFNPNTLAGDYAFAWQAGAQDSHARVFNLHLEVNDDDLLAGDAFFGYGPAMDESDADGRIEGFICNWAGPNNSHSLQSLVQSQSLIKLAGANQFTPVTSNLSYAPTNSCDYAAEAPNDQFVFDFDSDDDGIVDENDPDVAIINELETAETIDADGYLELITDTGFSLPITLDIID